ncbi:MAG: hypothetical protein LBF15_02925 [Candidatus Peribacteria bacterium]|jgi:hypothetical protein|nr:hypothetical protein [Candidatus Peribacteria bacterium]
MGTSFPPTGAKPSIAMFRAFAVNTPHRLKTKIRIFIRVFNIEKLKIIKYF